MKKKVNLVSVTAVMLLVLALISAPAQKCFGSFTLYDNEQFVVNQSYDSGTLYDTSRAFIVPGGSVDWLYAYNFSSANVSGGSINDFYAADHSIVNIFDGSISDIYAADYSNVNISGGSMNNLLATYYSSITFYGKNFVASDGLIILNGEQGLGGCGNFNRSVDKWHIVDSNHRGK